MFHTRYTPIFRERRGRNWVCQSTAMALGSVAWFLWGGVTASVLWLLHTVCFSMVCSSFLWGDDFLSDPPSAWLLQLGSAHRRNSYTPSWIFFAWERRINNRSSMGEIEGERAALKLNKGGLPSSACLILLLVCFLYCWQHFSFCLLYSVFVIL